MMTANKNIKYSMIKNVCVNKGLIISTINIFFCFFLFIIIIIMGYFFLFVLFLVEIDNKYEKSTVENSHIVLWPFGWLVVGWKIMKIPLKILSPPFFSQPVLSWFLVVIDKPMKKTLSSLRYLFGFCFLLLLFFLIFGFRWWWCILCFVLQTRGKNFSSFFNERKKTALSHTLAKPKYVSLSFLFFHCLFVCFFQWIKFPKKNSKIDKYFS